HSFDAAGNLAMPVSGWRADGVRWSGGFACPVGHPDHTFWRWVLSESGCTSDLIGDAELAELRARFARAAGEPGTPNLPLQQTRPVTSVLGDHSSPVRAGLLSFTFGRSARTHEGRQRPCSRDA